MSKELAASGQLSAETIKAVRKHWDNCSDVVALCDMALSSLRGTFADGIEAAAKLASDATGDEWRDGTLVKRIRALAQDQRSEAERIAGSRSNSGTQSSDRPTRTDRQEPKFYCPACERDVTSPCYPPDCATPECDQWPTTEQDADELLRSMRVRIASLTDEMLSPEYKLHLRNEILVELDAHLSRKEQ